MVEQGPQEYQFRHPKRLTMDLYDGVASGVMQLNDQVADGFMSVTDMRSDVVVVRKLPERARDYDQLGTVKIAKFLQVPKVESWWGKGEIRTKKESETWVMEVDDQAIADRVAQSNKSGKSFNEVFVDEFREKIIDGLRICMKREKLLNDNKFTRGFIYSYMFTSIQMKVALIEALILLEGEPRNLPYMAIGAGIYGVAGTIGHSGVWFDVIMSKLDQRHDGFFSRGLVADANDPFVRHNPKELLLPPVPVDRLVRGSLYLRKHKDELIFHSSDQNS